MIIEEDILIDDADMAALYAEFADEDRKLAEEGMAEYSANLAAEDAQYW